MERKIKSTYQSIRQKLYIVIYGTSTPAGKAFDIILLVFILLSVLTVMLETVKGFDTKYHRELIILEWIFTGIFTVEYILRIFTTDKPWKYIKSFYGVIDLLAVLPMYLAFFITGSQVLLSLRALRLLRIFRVLKITRYTGESRKLIDALKNSRPKIIVFLFTVAIICVLMGTVMYLVESPESGFKSIPHSIYWCIVTLTTVGFGDIAPTTGLGRFIASFIMITGYGIIAVPTGIVSAEYTRQVRSKPNNLSKPEGPPCPGCGNSNNPEGAKFCNNCGSKLKE